VNDGNRSPPRRLPGDLYLLASGPGDGRGAANSDKCAKKLAGRQVNAIDGAFELCGRHAWCANMMRRAQLNAWVSAEVEAAAIRSCSSWPALEPCHRLARRWWLSHGRPALPRRRQLEDANGAPGGSFSMGQWPAALRPAPPGPPAIRPGVCARHCAPHPGNWLISSTQKTRSPSWLEVPERSVRPGDRRQCPCVWLDRIEDSRAGSGRWAGTCAGSRHCVDEGAPRTGQRWPPTAIWRSNSMPPEPAHTPTGPSRESNSPIDHGREDLARGPAWRASSTIERRSGASKKSLRNWAATRPK